MSRFRQQVMPSETREARTLRWLAKETEFGFSVLDSVWADMYHSSAEAAVGEAYVVAFVSAPAPPEGYGYLVEGVCNISWTGTAFVNLGATVYAGKSSVVATATAFLDSTAGSLSCHLAAFHSPRSRTTYRFELEAISGATAVDVANRGLWARVAKEG